MLPTDPNCIFCKIVAGQIPCHKIHEDDNVLAFLDVGPLSQGHTLVIPKGHWVTLDQVLSEISAAIGKVLPVIAKAVCDATGTPDFNILQNNGKLAHQAVGHVHFHIIPRPDGLRVPNLGKYADGQMAQVGARVRACLDS